MDTDITTELIAKHNNEIEDFKEILTVEKVSSEDQEIKLDHP